MASNQWFNFLPSKGVLRRRHIIGESHCETCGHPDEDLFHIVVDCPWARRFWAEVKHVTGKVFPQVHPASWAKDLLSGLVCTLEDAAVFVCGGWSLWSSRNDRAHGRNRWNPLASARHVANMVESLVCLNAKSERSIARLKEKWRPPIDGRVN